jgi:hypothetical protein
MATNKKLQIFISSTYRDLIKERQAAVEAILNSSNIPAGMELFTAGNESQMEVIKRWIDDSDIYCLILGVRYGSVNASVGLSYTEIEYKYAIDQAKPVFAIVLAEDQLAARLALLASSDPELSSETRAKYSVFREYVLSKVCRFFSDEKDIKISIMESIMDFIKRLDFAGWVKGNEIPDYESMIRENTELKNEIAKIRQESQKPTNSNRLGEHTLSDMVKMLENHRVALPAGSSKTKKPEETSLLRLFLSNVNSLNVGVNNAYNASAGTSFIFYNVGSPLLSYGLTVEQKYTNVVWTTIRTSEMGLKFIRLYHKSQSKRRNT